MRTTGEVSTPKATDVVIFDPGSYNARLVEAFLVAGTKYQSDEPQIEAVFMWEVEEDVKPVRDGFNAVKYNALTGNLEFNSERKYVGKFQTRIEALAGQQLSAEDVTSLDVHIDTPDFVTTFDELLGYLTETDDQGRPRRALLKSIKLGERELIGGEVILALSVTEKTKNGQKQEYQKIESVTAIPRRRAARGARAAAPTEDDQAALMDPPPTQGRRRATTEPDLPF